MSFVLDSSVALAWCFEDERTPEAILLLDRVTETGASAPLHWPLEVSNGLLMGVRRKRVDDATRIRMAGFLHDLPIVLDPETAEQVWTATARLADRFRLTIYDAAYLELAQRQNLPLASFDRELHDAGILLGVKMLGIK